MPRSSKHKPHRQHKHGARDSKEPSGSEGEEPVESESAKEGSSRKSRDEDVRVSRAAKGSSESTGKRKFSASEAGVLLASAEEEASTEYFPAKRWKDKAERAVSERWNGEAEGYLEGKFEGSGTDLQIPTKEERGTKNRFSEKGRTSRRFEASNKDGTVSRSASSLDAEEGKRTISSKGDVSYAKRKSDREFKDVHQLKEGREMVGDKNETSVLFNEGSKSQKIQSRGSQEQTRRREVENSERQLKDDLRNPELEEEIEKRMRRRDGLREKDKWQADIRDHDNRYVTPADEYSKNGRYKDERDEIYKDSHYRDKYKEESGLNHRDQKHRDEKHRGERSSRDRTDERSDSKHIRDESRLSGSHHKKYKLDNDHDASPMVERNIVEKDSRVKRRSSDENDGNSDTKRRSIKEVNDELGSKVLKSSRSMNDRSDSHTDNIQSDRDGHLVEAQRRNSPSSSKHISKHQHRNGPKQVDLSFAKSSPSEGTRRQGSASPERVSEIHSSYRGRLKRGGHSDESILGDVSRPENETATHHSPVPVGRSPRLDIRTSPIPLRKRSSSPASYEHRHSSGSRRGLDIDESRRSRDGSKDVHSRYFSSENRGRNSATEKPVLDIYAQSESHNTDGGPRNGSVNSSNRISPPLGRGVDGPLFTSMEEDSRSQASDRKFNGSHKRNEFNSGRSQQGNAWKGISNWTPPPANFIPFQPPVGPASAGFHPVLPQFPAPPIFGMRPPMELNHAGLPFHMHDSSRFSGHGRPYGWCIPGDDSCQPPMQGHLHSWDARSSFGEDTHPYGKPDWEQSRRVSRGWEMKAETWKGQNGDMVKDPEFQGQHLLEEPSLSGQGGQRPRHERQCPDRLPAESIEIKPLENAPTPKDEPLTSVKPVRPKGPEPKKVSSMGVSYYLSKLDISVDLAGPNFYEKLIHMQSSKGDDWGDSCAILSKTKDTTKPCSTEKNDRMPLYTASTNAVFERALALYRKRIVQMKTMKNTILSSGSDFKNVVLPAPDANMQGPINVSFLPDSSLQDIDSHNKNVCELKPVPSEDPTAAMECEFDRFGSAQDCPDQGGLSVKCREETASEPIDDLHVSGENGTSVCPNQLQTKELISKALKPDLAECSANLSRIPDSPENTH